jgi:hypothetical protein
MRENIIWEQHNFNKIEVTLINIMKMIEKITIEAGEEEIKNIIIIVEEEAEETVKFQIDLIKNTTKNNMITKKLNNHRFNRLKFK